MEPKRTAKLPVRQLAILAVCRFAEPVALTSVYPYLPEMIESFGIPTDKVAKWAGLASASFSFAQCFTAIIWGQLSDRFGRKYLILTSLCCTMLTSLNFGLSKSLPALITARAMGGAGSGTVGIIRTMVAEMVPQKELQPRAFSVMPLVWTIGSILGPSFGGSLANPVKRYPIFRNSWLLQEYPFLLPNLASAVLFFIGIVVGILFLRETLDSRKHRKDYGLMLGQIISRACRSRKPAKPPSPSHGETEPLLSQSSTAGGESLKAMSQAYKRPRYRDVLSPQSNINLVVYTLLAMHSQAYDQLLPIFMHHPAQDIDDPEVRLPFRFSGGFGISSSRIGLLFTIYGITGMFFQFLFFPPIAKKFGVLNCLRAVAVAFPVVYFLTPFTALMQTSAAKQAVMLPLMLMKCWLVIFAFPCSTILLTNSAASLSILGTLNGIATSTSAMGRAAGPFIGGNLFTLGVDKGYVIMPWWTLSLLALFAAIPVYFLKEMEGFSAGDGDDSGIDDTDIEEDDDEDMETAGAALRRSRWSYSPRRNRSLPGHRGGEIAEDAIEDEPGPPLRKVISADHRSGRGQRRMSSAIGIGNVGLPNARSFSNSLGATRSGFGAEPRQGT